MSVTDGSWRPCWVWSLITLPMTFEARVTHTLSPSNTLMVCPCSKWFNSTVLTRLSLHHEEHHSQPGHGCVPSSGHLQPIQQSHLLQLSQRSVSLDSGVCDHYHSPLTLQHVLLNQDKSPKLDHRLMPVDVQGDPHFSLLPHLINAVWFHNREVQPDVGQIPLKTCLVVHNMDLLLVKHHHRHCPHHFVQVQPVQLILHDVPSLHHHQLRGRHLGGIEYGADPDHLLYQEQHDHNDLSALVRLPPPHNLHSHNQQMCNKPLTEKPQYKTISFHEDRGQPSNSCMPAKSSYSDYKDGTKPSNPLLHQLVHESHLRHLLQDVQGVGGQLCTDTFSHTLSGAVIGENHPKPVQHNHEVEDALQLHSVHGTDQHHHDPGLHVQFIQCKVGKHLKTNPQLNLARHVQPQTYHELGDHFSVETDQPHKQHLARFSVQTNLLLNKSGLVQDHRLHHLWRVPGITITVTTNFSGKSKTKQKGYNTIGTSLMVPAHHLQTLHGSTGQQLQHLIPLPLQHLLLLYHQRLDLHVHRTESKLAQEHGLRLHVDHQQEVSGPPPLQLQGLLLKRQVYFQYLKTGHKIIFPEVVVPAMCDVSLIKKDTTVQPHTTTAMELDFHFQELDHNFPHSSGFNLCSWDCCRVRLHNIAIDLHSLSQIWSHAHIHQATMFCGWEPLPRTAID